VGLTLFLCFAQSRGVYSPHPCSELQLTPRKANRMFFLLKQTVPGCDMAQKLWIRCCSKGEIQTYGIVNRSFFSFLFFFLPEVAAFI